MKTVDIGRISSIEPLIGTNEWYRATDYIHGDLYEAEELFRNGHSISCNRLYLIHYPDGTVYEPILPVAEHYLGYPVYDNGTVVLLSVDFSGGTIHILRFYPESKELVDVAKIPLSAVENCYNLILYTEPLSLMRQPNDNTFEIVWPERVRFSVEDNETLIFRDGDKLYFNIWYDDPVYHEETVIRDLYSGRVCDRFSGNIQILPNGEKWLVK